MLKLSASFGALALAFGFFAVSEPDALLAPASTEPVTEPGCMDEEGADHENADAAPMSIQSDNDLSATVWTDASCKQACLDAGCKSYQYIGRPSGGGSCTCSHCSWKY